MAVTLIFQKFNSLIHSTCLQWAGLPHFAAQKWLLASGTKAGVRDRQTAPILKSLQLYRCGFSFSLIPLSLFAHTWRQCSLEINLVYMCDWLGNNFNNWSWDLIAGKRMQKIRKGEKLPWQMFQGKWCPPSVPSSVLGVRCHLTVFSFQTRNFYRHWWCPFIQDTAVLTLWHSICNVSPA